MAYVVMGVGVVLAAVAELGGIGIVGTSRPRGMGEVIILLLFAVVANIVVWAGSTLVPVRARAPEVPR